MKRDYDAMNVEPTPGRRKNSSVDELRTVAWYAAVRERASLTTPYQLEKHFTPEKFRYGPDGECIRPCQWDKYARGKKVPSAKTAARVEARYPGTKSWLTLPLWRVIRDPPPPLAELHAIITAVRPALAAHLSHPLNLPQTERRHSYRLSSIKTIDSLWRQGDVNALTALLACVRDAELARNPYQHAEAALAAMHVFFLVATRAPFYSIRRPLFKLLKERFFMYRYPMGFTLCAEWVDIDDAVDSLRRAFALAQQFNIGLTPHNRGRLAYWMYREGLYIFGTAHLGALPYPLSPDQNPSEFQYAQRCFQLLRERLTTNLRRNPKRFAGWLASAVICRMIENGDIEATDDGYSLYFNSDPLVEANLNLRDLEKSRGGH